MGNVEVTKGRLLGLSVVALFLAIIWLAGPYDVASDSALFSAAPASRSLSSVEIAGPPIIRERFVHVNWSALTPDTPQFRLNLFDDTVVTAVRERVDRSVIDGYVWVGHVAERPSQRVTISVRGTTVVGAVAEAEQAIYTIQPLGPASPGLHLVRQVDTDAIREPGGQDYMETPLVIRPGGDESRSAMCEDGSVIDLMVVYTPAAREAQGGVDGMEALINQRLSDMNSANEASGVSFTWRLVEAAEVDYAQSDSINTDLLRLQRGDDGFLDEVHAMRDAVKADLVGLLVAEGNQDACGFAYKMNQLEPYNEEFGFGVTALDYPEPYSCNPLTLSHEFGHNMGNAHDRDHAGGSGVFPYSYGYQSPQRSFRTIMSYDCPAGGCPRINQWSNPRVMVDGEPTGIDYADAPERSADVARSMNEAAELVANFRSSCVVDPPTVTPTATLPPAETPITPTVTMTPTALPTASRDPNAAPDSDADTSGDSPAHRHRYLHRHADAGFDNPANRDCHTVSERHAHHHPCGDAACADSHAVPQRHPGQSHTHGALELCGTGRRPFAVARQQKSAPTGAPLSNNHYC